MALSFLSPTRTVLLISDDALYVYNSGPSGARVAEIISWDADNFEKNVASIIAKDCGGKPVLILNDMVEQHYRKERVIRTGVSVLDKSGMLKRKLNVSFPNYPVRAAYPLKEKLPKTDKKQAADIYIFAALPNSNQFAQTVGAARESLSSIAGLCLLPVESSDMVKTLGEKIRKGKKEKSKWVIFMGQHKSGGLRQIVTKDGELALTRMTPIVDVDVDANAWANEAQQELQATMSYLSRFGYHESEGLDVIAIGDPAACQSLEAQASDDCKFTSMTAQEAARHLGLPFARGSDDRYADILHVAWAGRKNKFILPMSAVQLEQISKPRQMAMLGSFVLLLGAAFFAYQAFNEVQSIAEISSDLTDGKRRYSQLEVQYQKEVRRKEELGFDVRLVQSSIAIIEGLKKNQISSLSILSGIGRALGQDLRIDKLTIEREQPPARTANFFNQQNEDKPQKLFDASMQMTYPATSDVDKGNSEVKGLSVRLRKILPEYNVSVTKLLKDYEYVEQIVVESGDLEKKDLQQDFVAEIAITGTVKQDD